MLPEELDDRTYYRLLARRLLLLFHRTFVTRRAEEQRRLLQALDLEHFARTEERSDEPPTDPACPDAGREEPED